MNRPPSERKRRGKKKTGARDAGLPPEDRAREICLRALERRMRSRRELEERLRRRGLSAEVYIPVLDRLTEVGLVDDEAFARAWVESRQRSKPRGRRGLASELFQKGISPEISEKVLDELAQEQDPVEAARRAVAPKLRSLSGKPPDEVRRKAEAFLLRRGFSYATAREALREVSAEDDWE